MKRGFFVTGTDTGVGKTFVSSLLLKSFVQQGVRAVGMKPVAAGCRRENNLLISEDVEQLLAAGNVPVTISDINPYAFEPPLAPHIAAQQAGETIIFDPILEKYHFLQIVAEVVIVEGVGGFRVPLNDTQDTADLAVAFGLPVILVVGMRLGCLNHALLTMEAISNAGLDLAGWIANAVDSDMVALDENIDALKKRLPAPHIATIPFLSDEKTLSSTFLNVGGFLS